MNENAKIRVLIAEDDPIQNDLLKDALELEPDMACCGQACDGLEALAKLQTEQPDVLLLDIVMPNMDGVDLLNELRENPPPKRPKVIAISAYGQEHIARAALAQGAEFIACQMSMDMMGIQHEELLDEVTIGGVATYMERADKANVNLFI